MTRPVQTTVFAALLAGTLFAPAAFADPVTITFVQTNDIDRMEGTEERGGIARLATVIGEARAEGHALLVHSGDTISPSLLSGIDKGAHMIDLLNQVGVDVMVPGNHEFDFGPEAFRDRIAEAEFPILGTNIFEADGTHPANTVEEYWTEIDGIRIAFYGLTTEDTVELATPGDITFGNSVETGIAKAAELRAEGADFVVAVVHTPLAVDLELARADAADLILSGHDEVLMSFFDGVVAFTESASQADFVQLTSVTIDKTVAADGTVSVTWWPAFLTIDTADVTPDPTLATAVQGYLDQLAVELGVVIGTTQTALDSRRAIVRGEESSIGDLIADAMRAAVDADIAITNGGGIRADRQYAAGTELTRADIFAELPFGNTLVKLELTGAQIVAALENGFSQIEAAAGRFPQVAGLSVVVDADAAPGSRVVEVTVGGEPIDPERTYTVATNDFMANGGDGYEAFVGAPQLIDVSASQLMASHVIAYVEELGTIAPVVEGRITFR